LSIVEAKTFTHFNAALSWARHREIELENPAARRIAGPRSQSTARAAEYVDNSTPRILRMRQDGVSAIAEEQKLFSLRNSVAVTK
jgi:hypothetical protein